MKKSAQLRSSGGGQLGSLLGSSLLGTHLLLKNGRQRGKYGSIISSTGKTRERKRDFGRLNINTNAVITIKKDFDHYLSKGTPNYIER